MKPEMPDLGRRVRRAGFEFITTWPWLAISIAYAFMTWLSYALLMYLAMSDGKVFQTDAERVLVQSVLWPLTWFFKTAGGIAWFFSKLTG